MSAVLSAISAIIVAIITGAFSYSAVKKSAEKRDAEIVNEIKIHNAVVDEKIDNLTKKVEKHNGVIERTFRLEEKMKVANHRLTDLEEIQK